MNKSERYSRRVEQVAAALHEDCRVEWQALSMIDPSRRVSMHGPDAHYAKAHALVRRIWPKLDEAR